MHVGRRQYCPASTVHGKLMMTIISTILVIFIMSDQLLTTYFMKRNINSTYHPALWKLQGKSENSRVQRYEPVYISNKYIFNCTNIDQINISIYGVGNGRSKVVDIGQFNGQMVVVKRLPIYDRTIWEPRELLFLKEILMRDQLEHPSIINLLGFCLRHLNGENFKRVKLKYSDISAVYEYGDAFDIQNVTSTLSGRLQHASDLVDLIWYLHNSPLGSLIFGDFKENHFLMVKNRIKIIDLDFMHNVEFPCDLDQPFSKCPFNRTCQPLNELEKTTTYCDPKTDCSIGVCRGSNVQINIHNIYKNFLKYLLEPSIFPIECKPLISKLFVRISSNDISIDDLIAELKVISSVYYETQKTVNY